MFNNNEIIVHYNEYAYGKEFKNICDVYPIVPAKNVEKSWWKIMKTHYDIFLSNTNKYFKSSKPTIKYCPGINDFTNYGYIVPAWQDFQFWVNDDGEIEWVIPERMQHINNIKSHGRAQIDTCPIMESKDTSEYILKLVSPWFISTPKGTSIIICKPFYHYSNDFDICPGVLDSDINELSNKGLNIFIRCNVKNEVIHIKAGQPLIQFIPFKRTNWKLTYMKSDKNFVDWVNEEQIAIDSIRKRTRMESNLIDKNSMTKFRHDDSNKKFK